MNNNPLQQGSIKLTTCSDFRQASGLTLSSSGNVNNAALASIGSVNVIGWGVSGDASTPAEMCFKMPKSWDRKGQVIKIDACARKTSSGGTDENTDLALWATLSWLNPGSTTLQTLTTPAKYTLPACGLAASKAFTEFTLDLGARLNAEGKQIEPGAIVSLAIYPNETVGSSDMIVEAMFDITIGEDPSQYRAVRQN